MAECVSCGKDIPAGKFFCDDCYVRMKGRRGPSGEVPEVSAADHDAGAGSERPPAVSGPGVQATVPTEVSTAKRLKGDLTPAAGKKVISMKPSPDRAGKEKAGKKKFTVTITFSERTYAALARLKPGRKGESEVPGDETGGPPASRGRAARAARPEARRGRPNLKAVEGTSSGEPQRRGGFRGAVGYRERPLDGKDMASMLMASMAVLVIVLLSFQPWARVAVLDEESLTMQTVEVTGIELGAITYICIALVAAAFLYMVAARLWGGALAAVDFGVVFILAGILFIPLLYAAIASNARFLTIALERLGKDISMLPEQFERSTLWPTYVMVIAGAFLAFAGLLRLSESRADKDRDVER